MTGRNLITDLQQLEKKKNKELEIKVKKAMARAGSGGMVEAFQEKVAGAGAGLMARVKAGAGAVAERVKSERDQVLTHHTYNNDEQLYIFNIVCMCRRWRRR